MMNSHGPRWLVGTTKQKADNNWQLLVADAIPVAAKGSTEAKPLAPTRDLPSAAVTRTSCAAATGWLTNQVKLTRASAVGKSDVALDL